MKAAKARVFLAVVFAAWLLAVLALFYLVGFDNIVKATATADVHLLLAAFALVIIARVTYVLNLGLLLHFLKGRLSLRCLFEACFAGFFMDDVLPTILPMGEMTTGYLIHKRGVALPKAMAAVIAQAISWFAGFVFLFVFALGGLMLTGAVPQELLVASLVPFILFCLLMAVIVIFAVDMAACEALVSKTFGVLAFLLSRFTRYKHLSKRETQAFLVKTVRGFHSSISPFLEQKQMLLFSFALLFFHHAATAYAFFLTLQAFHISISLFLALFVFAVITLVSLISFVPGGLGVYEAVSIAFLSIPAGPLLAVLATSAFRLMEYWFIVFTGGFVAFRTGAEAIAEKMGQKKRRR